MEEKINFYSFWQINAQLNVHNIHSTLFSNLINKHRTSRLNWNTLSECCPEGELRQSATKIPSAVSDTANLAFASNAGAGALSDAE